MDNMTQPNPVGPGLPRAAPSKFNFKTPFRGGLPCQPDAKFDGKKFQIIKYEFRNQNLKFFVSGKFVIFQNK